MSLTGVKGRGEREEWGLGRLFHIQGQDLACQPICERGFRGEGRLEGLTFLSCSKVAS